jgi:hypothetical protein
LKRATAAESRIQERIAQYPGRVVTLGACLVAAVTLTLAGAALAWAADEAAKPRIEVAPGVYLASASQLAEAGSAQRSSTLSRSAPARKIVGGTTTGIRRWPWQVSIDYLFPKEFHNCGGTLVAPTIVVTAAHCMTLGATRNFRPPDEFRVITGRTKLSSSAGQVHDLANYFWFVDKDGKPLWDPKTVQWDVVFLQLTSSSKQQTIKIAGPGEESVWTPGRRAFITGWGTTSENAETGSNVLRQARIRMIADSTCDSVYGAALFSTVMACAGDLAGGVDACSGDSGGPLVVPIAGGGYRLIGDTSWGAGCGVPGIPGVYGRLASDPIRSALQRGIEGVAGVNVVGSGAEPSNQFRFGSARRNRGRGTTRLAVRVPGRGKVVLHRTRRVGFAVVYPSEAGHVRVPVRPRGKAKRRLSRTGAARVRARVTYTPMGGDRRTKSTWIRLVKRR